MLGECEYVDGYPSRGGPNITSLLLDHFANQPVGVNLKRRSDGNSATTMTIQPMHPLKPELDGRIIQPAVMTSRISS